jgi:ring-1,2-phenylacetyl-CoA epoxidase subunit PaaE
MSAEFNELTIKKIDRQTDKAVSVYFEIPEDLKQAYSYQAGQYLTLRHTINGEDIRRAYSCSTSPLNDEIAVTVKEVEQGRFSTYLNRQAKDGDKMQVMVPNGTFTLDRLTNKNNSVVLLGGGSGITPLISIAETSLKQTPDRKVYLFYANTDESQIIFKDKLDKMEKEYDSFEVVHILTSTADENWTGHKGTFDSQMCISLLNDKVSDIESTDYYLCGPSGLMQENELALTRLGVKREKIHKELFSTSIPKDEGFKIVSADSGDEIEDREIEVRLYGDEHKLTVPSDETVLMAAIQNSLDPPYSCQIGACSTCRAKLVSGKVMMEDYDALTDDEVEDGYILTCTSHPLTDNVVIDYDD